MAKAKGQYTPPKDSLAWRVCDYLRANPDEELLRGDIVTKFGADPSLIDSELQRATTAHLLERIHLADSGYVWRLKKQSRGAFPRPFASSVSAAKRAVRAQRSFDISALVIEKDVPLIDPPKRKNYWEALFRRMEVGDSIQVPAESRQALSHAQQKYRKTAETVEFAIRKVSETHCRIWRIS